MVVKVVEEVTKEGEVTIFQQRATEAATRCPPWGKLPPTVTHCQHRAWRARTRTKAPSLPTHTTPCRPGWASPPHEQQEVVVTLTKEELVIMVTLTKEELGIMF